MSDVTNGQLENSKVAIVRWLKIAAQPVSIGTLSHYKPTIYHKSTTRYLYCGCKRQAQWRIPSTGCAVHFKLEWMSSRASHGFASKVTLT